MSALICKVCGEQSSRTTYPQLRCTICGRSQNWFGTAKQPGWWPSRLKTTDRIERQWRWTHWTFSLVVAAFTLVIAGPGVVNVGSGVIVNVGSGVVNVGSGVIGGINNSIEKARFGEEVFVPNLVGWNLGNAQDCLKKWAIYNSDIRPEDESVTASQITTLNWTVTRQSQQGVVRSKNFEIILYVAKKEPLIRSCPERPE